MKILFISDIHGIKTNLEKIKEKIEEHQIEKLVVLGDLYYIGPRNKMQEGYDIPYVQSFLESYRDKLICIRGNCDSDIDIEISNFPIISELGYLSTNSLDIYLTHGHIYNEDHWNKDNTILIYGHYHIPFIKEVGTNLFINPGSISLPKGGYNPTYLVWDEKEFTIYDVSDNIIAKKKIRG